MSNLILNNLRICPAKGWMDVTGELEVASPPLTLARPDGLGAIQFSTAAYEWGEVPSFTTETLWKMLRDFASARELGPPSDESSSQSSLLTVAASFRTTAQFVRVWYCSNGRDLAFITYVSERSIDQAELADCESMVAALRFCA